METRRLIFHEIQGAYMETFCKITMPPPQFGLKLKTFPLLHRQDHFLFTRKVLKKVPNVTTVNQLAR